MYWFGATARVILGLFLIRAVFLLSDYRKQANSFILGGLLGFWIRMMKIVRLVRDILFYENLVGAEI